ncbi:hypothetical protein OG357_07220 [Streptomyces sp. NBC_01255]|nr:hypothetical protein [Streptomyces sp. NBC_01255]
MEHAGARPDQGLSRHGSTERARGAARIFRAALMPVAVLKINYKR